MINYVSNGAHTFIRGQRNEVLKKESGSIVMLINQSITKKDLGCNENKQAHVPPFPPSSRNNLGQAELPRRCVAWSTQLREVTKCSNFNYFPAPSFAYLRGARQHLVSAGNLQSILTNSEGERFRSS